MILSRAAIAADVSTTDAAPASAADELGSIVGLPVARAPSAAQIEATDRRRLEQDLRTAVQTRQLQVHYQPRVCLRTGIVRGAEALARWRHRRRGMVPPGVFIPIAESNGLIGPIGSWVLSAACTEAAAWPGEAGVSVNVSAAQLAQGLLPRQVADALAASGLTPERLELELTESMLVDAGIETLLVLSNLRDRGIGLALDDFGTGYASLATLKRLPFSKLKLDRSLVRGLPHDAEDVAVVRAIVQMGHALGLQVVAEGIATWAQHSLLRDLGCEEGQAFLLGRPMPGAELRQLLLAGSAAACPATEGTPSGPVSEAEGRRPA